MSAAVKIDKKIVKASVKKEDTPEAPEEASKPVPEKPKAMSTPTPKKKSKKRPELLWGLTVKVTTPDCNIYVTVNVDDEHRPLEVFFSSSHLESQEWVALATRLASSMLRSHDDEISSLDFIAKEFIKTESPGKYLGKVLDSKKGEMHNGIIQHLGKTLLAMSKRLKALVRQDQLGQEVAETTKSVEPKATAVEKPEKPISSSSAGTCPECFSTDTRLMDGCLTCMECSYSKCG